MRHTSHQRNAGQAGNRPAANSPQHVDAPSAPRSGAAQSAFHGQENSITGPRVPETAVLAAQLEFAVRRRTGDRVRLLKVQIQADSVTLDGRCASFYCKQLAQQAALTVLEKAQCTANLIDRIEVW